MKVTFLTECNAEIGFGHITRIFSIAYEYKIQGNSVELIVDGDEKLVKVLINLSKLYSWIGLKAILNY